MQRRAGPGGFRSFSHELWPDDDDGDGGGGGWLTIENEVARYANCTFMDESNLRACPPPPPPRRPARSRTRAERALCANLRTPRPSSRPAQPGPSVPLRAQRPLSDVRMPGASAAGTGVATCPRTP